MNRSTPVIRTTLIAALGAIPGLVLLGLVTGNATIAVSTLVAVAAATAMSIAATRVGGPALVASGVAGALVAAGVVSVAAPSGAAGRGAVDTAFDALTHGWSTLLTSPVPADPSPRILVPLATVVWLATGASSVLALRATNSGPTPPSRALLPVAAAVVAAAVVAGREQFHPLAVGVLSGLIAAGFIATFRPRPDARARAAGSRPGVRRAATQRRAIGPLVGTLTAAALLGALVGPALAFGREPFDPRDQIDPPAVPAGATNPLDLFASRQRAGDQAMFSVEVDEPILTRLVALDDFDGARWTTSAGYEPSGTIIASSSRNGVTTRDITASVTIDGLTGPWLPVAGDLTRVFGVPFRIDPASGSILTTTGDATGATYRFEALVVDADLNVLQGLPAAADADAIEARELPQGVPPILEEMAMVATAGATTPFVQAVMLERYLRLNFDRDEEVTAGHSFGHLSRALTETGAGTDEQFAAAFAVLGRTLGLPTRVVVGFGPGELRADGSFQVSARDVRVWPEVKFDGAGWIPFDPSPERDEDTTPIAIGPGGGEGFVVQEADELIGLDADRPPPAAVTERAATDWPTLVLRIAVVVAGVIVLAAIVILATKRARTRRRRNADDATDRVVGAWSDVLERFAEIDAVDPRTRTVEQLVDETEMTTSSLTGLYRPVLRALYDGSECTDVDAEQAWRARDRFVRATRREASVTRVAGWALDPRPMLAQWRSEQHDHGDTDAKSETAGVLVTTGSQS